MICFSTKVCLCPLIAVAAPNTNRNRTDVVLLAYILRKYYIRCLFFFCMLLYTVSGPTCHLKTWRVSHVVTNIDHRKLKKLAFGCPPVAFGRQASSFESWNLGHREQEYLVSLRLSRSAFVCLLRSVRWFVTDVSGQLRIRSPVPGLGVQKSDDFKYIETKAWSMAYVFP
jgi:hypothetical protein